jgi:O-antigen/teichoic acid export membrane protein
MDLPTIKEKLFAGSVVGFLRIGLAIPVYLVMTPIILNTLGEERFGLWSFSTILISMLNLADFGFKNSLVYYVARQHEDKEAVSQHFAIATLLYLSVSSLIALVILFFHGEIIEKLLQVPSHLFEEAQFLLIVTVIAFIVRMMAIPYQAMLEGHQEISWSQSVFLLWMFAYVSAVFVALILRPDIYGLGIASLFSNVVILLGFYGVTKWRIPFLRFDPARLKVVGFGRMLNYGAGMQLAAAAIALREPLYKIVLVRTYDLSTVAAFEIAFKLCTQLVAVITTPLLGVLGVTALLSQRHEDLTRILRPLFMYGVIVLVPAVLFAHTFSTPLFNLWLGQKGNEAAHLFPGMFLGFSIYYSTEVLYKSIQGSGRSWYSAILQLSVLVLQIALLISLTFVTWSVAGSLVVGFAAFALANFVMFGRCYGTISLLQPTQMMWLALPTILYLGYIQFLSQDSHAWIFLGYLVVYFIVLKHSGMVDPRSVIGLFRGTDQSHDRTS